MNVVPDDAIYQVDEVFLGPERFRFPWRWTYRQWGIAVVVFLALQAIERQVGIPVGIWPLLFSGLVTAGIAQWSRQAINWDRGIRVAVEEARLEVGGPREDTHTVRAALTIPRSRRARRRRKTVLAETYGTDDTDPAESESMPSFWSQFTPKKTRGKRQRKRSDSVDDHGPELAGGHARDDVATGGHR